MRFQKVRISNLKKIEDMELCFAPGVNLLIGDNGVGKTSALEALTIALSIFFNGITGVTRQVVLSQGILEKRSQSMRQNW